MKPSGAFSKIDLIHGTAAPEEILANGNMITAGKGDVIIRKDSI